MASQNTRSRSPENAQELSANRRLSGIDMARGAALLAMMTVHSLPITATGTTGGGEPTWTGLLLSGRAAALFALLAGVSLSLGRVPASRNRRGLAYRAAVVAAVGFCLGALDVDVSVILVYYGALFVCAIPILRLGPRALGALAVSWIIVAPIAAYGLRTWLRDGDEPLKLGHNPMWTDFTDPTALVADLAVTGTYPVIIWFGYILVGLWIGRLALGCLSIQIGLLVVGCAAALTAKGAEWVLLGPLGGRTALLATPQAGQEPLEVMLRVDLSDVDQTGSLWWLLTAAPHSGTTLDLLHTCGTSAAVLAGFLLASRIRALGGQGVLLPLAGAGGMTLTLYSAHILVLAWSQHSRITGLDDVRLLAIQFVSVLAAGLAFRVKGWRGPIERVTHAAYQLGLRSRGSDGNGDGGGSGASRSRGLSRPPRGGHAE